MPFLIIPLFIFASAYAGVSSTPNASGYYEITDSILADTTLTSDKQYLLTNFVFVENATLTIEAGTIVRGKQGINVDGVAVQEAGTLVITRTGEINAVGTPAQPIVFTYELDNADPIANPTTPLTQDASRDLNAGFWGGLIILGNAPINNNQEHENPLLIPGTDVIYGIAEPVATDANPDLRGIYGGNEPNDSSGVLKYVSIRHCGFDVGAWNELNGLTLAGVGRGTEIEYIEVVAGDDDGFEIFGGTVCLKYCLSAYNNDDAFDYDQGWNGEGQFWAVVQADNGVDGDKGGEFDGDDQAGALPRGVPAIYNMTVIGGKGGQIDYDKDAGGYLYNSISVDSGNGQLDINSTSAAMQTAGLLKVANNIWCADSSDVNGGIADFSGTAPTGENNVNANPLLGADSYLNLVTLARDAENGVPLIPAPTPEVMQNLAPYSGHFVDPVNFKGAFDPATEAWTKGWTVGSKLGYFIENN